MSIGENKIERMLLSVAIFMSMILQIESIIGIERPYGAYLAYCVFKSSYALTSVESSIEAFSPFVP